MRQLKHSQEAGKYTKTLGCLEDIPQVYLYAVECLYLMSHCQLMFLIFSFFRQQMVAWHPSYSEITGQRVCFRGRCAGLASGAPCAVGASKRDILLYSHHKNLNSQKGSLVMICNDKGYPRNLYSIRPCFRLIEYHAQIAFHYRTILNHAI